MNTASGFHRPALIPLREAVANATPGAVILAVAARMSLDAQQELVDMMQASINRARTAQMKGERHEAP